MFIPYSTDAPIYHWPIATGVVIALNVLIHVGLALLPEETRDFILSWTVLTFGNFNPITWITSVYLHADFMHLIGNMIFLYVFGMIVEGKLGWWKFLLVYNAIGFAQCGVEQMLMIFADKGGSLGASGAIFGLMAIALIWAPANNVQLAYVGWSRIMAASTGMFFEVTVSFFVGFYLCMQLAFGALHVSTASSSATAMCSEILHLLGAAAGAVVGIAMLRMNLVDCENWDIFSVRAGQHLKSRAELDLEYIQSSEGKARQQQAQNQLLESIRTHLAAEERIAAYAAYKRGLNQFPGFQLPENDLQGLIAALRKLGMVDETISLMVTFLRKYPERDGPMRLALAQQLIEKKKLGKQALSVLGKVDGAKLEQRHLPVLEKLQRHAEHLVADDPYEVAPEDW